MLTAARKLFDRQGHERTTFEEIAQRSGFGVATVYKYFPSKHHLVVALLRPDLEKIIQAGARVIGRPPNDPAEAVIALLEGYGDIGGREWGNRELLRLTVFPGTEKEGVLSDFIREADRRTQEQIATLLTALKASGRVPSALDVSAATWVVFSLLNHHFGLYLADESQSFRRTFSRLRKAIRTVFDDWRTR